jgi:hypothetical protein
VEVAEVAWEVDEQLAVLLQDLLEVEVEVEVEVLDEKLLVGLP